MIKLHILNWGMGVESTAILLRWIFEPETRPFEDWSQLIICVAQTGDEFPETKHLCETYILPLLRQLRVRLVQVGKAGPYRGDGYVVLSDTREPYEMHIRDERIHSLSSNMLMDGWSQRVGRPHICAVRWKGEVLDYWIADNIFEAFGPYLGYNSEETGRMKDAQDYGCRGNEFLFPLIMWGWTRERCAQYIFEKLGVHWHRSCCVFCPFQRKEVAIMHYSANQEAAAYALWVEFNAMAMNPRMILFARHSARSICEEGNLHQAIARFEEMCDETRWAMYRVRRIYRKVGAKGTTVNSARNVETLAVGTRAEMEERVLELAQAGNYPVVRDSHLRCYSHIRDDENKVYPAIEGFWVASPNLIRDKCHLKTFDLDWRKLVQTLSQAA